MANARVDKVNAELKRSIYEILSKKVKSPELTEMFSIVKVDADKELTYAKVYVLSLIHIYKPMQDSGGRGRKLFRFKTAVRQIYGSRA